MGIGRHDDFSRLRYRRQFLLAPYRLGEFSHWKTISIARKHILHVHNDLQLKQIRHERFELTLVGYLIDPFAPSFNDEDILRFLATGLHDVQSAPHAAISLAGRWVLFASDGLDTVILNDPCGLREVVYSATSPQFWCASQAIVLAAAMGLEVDEATRAFTSSVDFQNDREPWWPGDATPYRDIKQLLPNHSLSVATKEVRRFWPTESLPSLSLKVGASTSAAILKNLVIAASRRFPLALPLTAGRDSRMILAATRTVSDVHYYTLQFARHNSRSADIRTPGRLLRTLGLQHNIIICPGSTDGAFADLYRGNVTTAGDDAAAIAAGLYAGYPQNRVSLSGHCSEIARCGVYEHSEYPDLIDGAMLAELAHLNNAFAIRHFDNWLREAASLELKYGYRILDLFYWEQRVGRWAANGQSQWDIIHERFSPFNCRPLQVAMLAVDMMHRRPPHYRLAEEMMRALWPRVLSEPFNGEVQSLQDRALSFLARGYGRLRQITCRP